MSDEHVTIDDILPRVEQLAGADRVVSELPGGLTNTNYKVDVGGRSYVVRVSSKDAGLPRTCVTPHDSASGSTSLGMYAAVMKTTGVLACGPSS